MPWDSFQPRGWDKYHDTNRLLRQRCRDPFQDMVAFAGKPLHEVQPHWRHTKLERLRAKRERARDAGSRCSPRELGREMAAARGWTGYLWDRLDARITGESGWNPCRHYPSTTNCNYAGPSACGIPQSNPCSKLLTWCGAATIGACPARMQIRWTLNYIASRYGSPASLPPFPASY